MVAAIRPRGRIIAAAMVSQPVPLSQEWLTASGVWITGTSVGTRAQMRELIQLHEAQPFEAQVQRVTPEATLALDRLKAGNAAGRQAIVLVAASDDLVARAVARPAGRAIVAGGSSIANGSYPEGQGVRPGAASRDRSIVRRSKDVQ